MLILPSKHFSAKYRKIVRKHPKLSEKIDTQLKLLIINPKHPSLRLHKISGKYSVWSISVTADLRILFDFVKTGVLLIDIGTHDEVY